MATLVRDPYPAEFHALLERRRRLGLDHRDEIWEGVLHMNPAPHGRHHRIGQQLAVALDGPARVAGLVPAMGEFNLGTETDYRVPDGAIHRSGPDQLYYETVAVVVEILSPGDESWEKLPFYADHDVDEVLIVDPETQSVKWFSLIEGVYRPIDGSGLIGLAGNKLGEQIEWG